jgi:ribosomal protein L32
MALPLPRLHPSDTLELTCLNCGSDHLYGDVCGSCGLCQRCDEFAGGDCYCEAPTAVERYQAATEASL